MERIRSSFFFVPVMGVLLGVVGGVLTIWSDGRLQLQSGDVPLGLASTVDSAREVLSTVAGATITFAAIAFSISLLIIQQASSEFSPRVVHTLFRDPFNKRVMALVMGTFTYCLVVLMFVRKSGDSSGLPDVPIVSVAFAVLLGIATIVSIVAFLNHSAHSMDVSEILQRVENEALEHVRGEWTLAKSDSLPLPLTTAPEHPVHIIRFDRPGWVQQIDVHAVISTLPAGTTAWVYAFPGRYAIPGAPLCALSTEPVNPAEMHRAMHEAVDIGTTRTMQQDLSFGLRQMVDVGLKALSLGINDPTTAQDAIFHVTAVLAEALRRDPPSPHLSDTTGRQVFLLEQPDRDDLVRLAFSELRRAAASQPTVCIYLLEALHLLQQGLEAQGLASRTQVLIEQARLVVAGCEAADVLPVDHLLVREAYRTRFADHPLTAPNVL